MGEQMNNLNSFDGGTMVERNSSILEENSNSESARDAAQAIEELQRAQADTLTDDEFDE